MNHSVLVVEDNALNSELLCDWLGAHGYAVSNASDLASAFQSVRDHPPDIVLLDVQLGNEDGLALPAWMRKQPHLGNVPVIAVTAHAMVTEQEAFLLAGCNACVSKPINFKLLAEQMSHWLSG